MNISMNYRPQVPAAWQGRVDDPNDPDSYRWHQWIELIDLTDKNLKPLPEGTVHFCFLGYCCDSGVKNNLGRTGTAKGPASIRTEMANLPLNFNRNSKLFDAGDLHCCADGYQQAHEELAGLVEKILSLNLFPILLGGGHDIAFGHYNGLLKALKVMSNEGTAKQENGGQMGIINFDAHFDMRPYDKGPNSGTMFSQIADGCQKENRAFSYFCLGIQMYGNTLSLFKKADALGTEYVLARDIEETTLPGIMERLDKFMAKNDHIYLTVCSDVFSSAYAPGVSAPQPFGLHPEISLKLLKHIFNSGKMISFDMAEVSPRFDEDNRTAKLAAIVIFALINSLAGLENNK